MKSAKRLRIALVGLKFGRQVLEHLLSEEGQKEFEVVGVCDLNTSLVAEVHAQSGLPGFADLEAMLIECDPDCVGLFTPPTVRTVLLDRCLRAGCHVMTTKPFCFDVREATAILQKAESLGLVLHLNSPAPELAPDLQTIQTWHDKYQLGLVIGARAEVWAPYYEKADGGWMDDPFACPAAPITRIGAYLIHDILDLAGEPENLHLRTNRVRTGRPTPDNALLTFDLPGGALGSLFASFCIEDGGPWRNALTMNFERGTIYRNIGPARPVCAWNEADLSLVRRNERGAAKVVEQCIIGEMSGSYRWDLFARDVREKRPPSPAYTRRILQGVQVLANIQSLEKAPQTHASQLDRQVTMNRFAISD